MQKSILIKSTAITSIIALALFVLIQPLQQEASNTPVKVNNISKANNDLSENQKLHKEIKKANQEMDLMIQSESELSIPKEFRQLEKEIATIETLIAKVEQQTGQKITSIFDKDIKLDPIEDKEFYQLEQEFEQLNDEMLDIVGQF